MARTVTVWCDECGNHAALNGKDTTADGWTQHNGKDVCPDCQEHDGVIWVVQGRYGDSWDVETYASTKTEAQQYLGDYRSNNRDTPYRIREVTR